MLKITIKGNQGEGKTRVAQIIADALKNDPEKKYNVYLRDDIKELRFINENATIDVAIKTKTWTGM